MTTNELAKFNRISAFIDSIGQKDDIQKSYLEKSIALLTTQEAEHLERVMQFFEEDGVNLSEQADAYYALIEHTRNETKYFIQNGCYRHSTYAEVAADVYFNEEIMHQYMVGLVLSDDIWTHHLKLSRYFRDFISKAQGESYLEIGPGYGNYFTTALCEGHFHEYTGVDLSPTSAQGAARFAQYFAGDIDKKWDVLCQNFLDYSEQERFDCIVMGEVLEHVEQPQIFMDKIYVCLKKGGAAFVSTVLNAPEIDHIYLFSTVEDVLELVEKSGLYVEDYLCTVEGDKPLEKALKKKMAITIALRLSKA